MNDAATPTPSSDQTVGPDKDFLEIVVKAIVDKADDVIIERSVDDLGVLIKLRVNEADMSKIVGKNGQTAKALRTLLRLVGSKYDLRVNLKILEPDGTEHRSERAEGFAPRSPRPPRAPRAPMAPRRVSSETQVKPAAEENTAEGGAAGSAFDDII